MTSGNIMKTIQSMLAEHVTGIIGEPMKVAMDKLQIKLANIAVKFKVSVFMSRDKYVHMCLVVKQQKYQDSINYPT